MKKWLLVIRAPFLLLPMVLAFLGTSVAWYEGFFDLGYALLAFFGLLLAHISVNVFNEYFDYRSGLDLHTKRTPFSGGSGALPGKLITSKQALWLAIITLLIILPIGVYFTLVKGWLLLPLLVVAAFCIVMYTPLILKTNWPEWAPGVGLGLLPVLGVYFVQTGSYTLTALAAAIPPGILVHNLLLLNEFPDIEADRGVGKRTLPITIGERNAAIFYAAATVLVYVWIIVAVIIGLMPAFTLIALLTVPLAVKAIRGAFAYPDMSKLVPALASNVLAVLVTQLLMGVGYVLAKLF